MSKIHLKTLPKATLDLANDFNKKEPSFLKRFYLSGGTALSLQLGHRSSEDLDFFTKDDFNPDQLQAELLQFGSLQDTEISGGTLNTFINGVQLQFLQYPYQLIGSFVDWRQFQLSSVEDVACTKLQTIGSRGSKKDFVDVYFLFERFTLEEMFKMMDEKYQSISYSKTHILKSLVFFEDAEKQPMPRMFEDVSWDDVRAKMIETVKDFKL